MFRYIAIAWPKQNSQHKNAAQRLMQPFLSKDPRWSIALDVPGLVVACISAQSQACGVVRFHANAGLIVGTIFRRGTRFEPKDACCTTSFRSEETAELVESKGRHLLTHYWGRYVALISGDSVCPIRVVRDPTGNLPCYLTTHKGLTLFFSSLEDCLRLADVQLTINWEFVAERIALGGLFASGTGLKEVSEVYGGECVEVTPDGLRRQLYWDPIAVSTARLMDNPAEAADSVRHTVKACTNSWASCYRSIIHRFSGGLDSSVILRCLEDAPSAPRVAAVTYFVPGGGADERRLARRVAADCRCEHIEYKRVPHVSLRPMLDVVPLVRPQPLATWVEIAPFEVQLARRMNASAVFTGHGGDSLFGRHSRDFVLTDYIHRYGVAWQLLAVASVTAPLVHTSFWGLLAGAARTRLFGHGLAQERKRLMKKRQLVSSVVVEQVLRRVSDPHPWLQSLTSTSWGIIHQLGMLLLETPFYDPLDREDPWNLELVSPLHAQPVVELCLTIPLQVHIAKSRDRAVARNAFKCDLPEEVIERPWKDRAPGIFAAIIDANLSFCRDVLLTGTLVREKLVERRSLEVALSGRPAQESGTASQILGLLSVEAWIQSLEACLYFHAQ